jgi:hypothetical protein
MGEKVGSAPACYGNSLGSNPNISQKIQNGQHKPRSRQHAQARQIIYKNKNKNKNNKKFSNS